MSCADFRTFRKWRHSACTLLQLASPTQLHACVRASCAAEWSCEWLILPAVGVPLCGSPQFRYPFSFEIFALFPVWNYYKWCCHKHSCTYLFFSSGPHSVTQAGMQWHDFGSLRPQLPGLRWLSHLSFLGNWDCRHAPPCPAKFCIFCRSRVLPGWPGWSWTSELKWSAHLGLPEWWDYRCEPLCVACIFIF